MTTRTIEYQETIFQEEEIVICDECNREVDEGGEEFNSDERTLHFCSSCMAVFGVFDPEQEAFRRVEEWLDSERTYRVNGNKYKKTIRDRILKARAMLRFVHYSMSLLLIVMSVMHFIFGVEAWGVYLITTVFYIINMLSYLSVDNAKTTIEKIDS